MPLAALLVVQGEVIWMGTIKILGFNAARGFVGGARIMLGIEGIKDYPFQCRSRLCWWCKDVAHSPCISCVQRLFWKVSGCLRWLSERMQNTYSNTTSLSGAIPCAISPCHAHGRIGKSRRCSAALRRIPATFHFVLCTIYIIAETAPNDKYLRPRKKASARGAADTSYGTNHRTVLKQDFLL